MDGMGFADCSKGLPEVKPFDLCLSRSITITITSLFQLWELTHCKFHNFSRMSQFCLADLGKSARLLVAKESNLDEAIQNMWQVRVWKWNHLIYAYREAEVLLYLQVLWMRRIVRSGMKWGTLWKGQNKEYWDLGWFY